jgi:hypothetical protein
VNLSAWSIFKADAAEEVPEVSQPNSKVQNQISQAVDGGGDLPF